MYLLSTSYPFTYQLHSAKKHNSSNSIVGCTRRHHHHTDPNDVDVLTCATDTTNTTSSSPSSPSQTKTPTSIKKQLQPTRHRRLVCCVSIWLMNYGSRPNRRCFPLVYGLSGWRVASAHSDFRIRCADSSPSRQPTQNPIHSFIVFRQSCT